MNVSNSLNGWLDMHCTSRTALCVLGIEALLFAGLGVYCYVTFKEAAISWVFWLPSGVIASFLNNRIRLNHFIAELRKKLSDGPSLPLGRVNGGSGESLLDRNDSTHRTRCFLPPLGHNPFPGTK